MRLLYDDVFAPITTEIGFLAADIERVVETFLVWQSEIRPRRLRLLERCTGIALQHCTPIAGPLSAAIEALLPLTLPVSIRRLFVPTVGPWVAYFDNHVSGTDCAAISYLAQRLGCRGLRVVAIAEEREERRPRGRRRAATMLEIYEPFATDWLNYRRTICMSHDDRWVFELSGEQQPFEEPENYAKPRIQDRFTPKMLDRYLRALGVRAFEDDFYLPPGSTASLIENRYWRWFKRYRRFTLDGALTRFEGRSRG